jgi:hypothetical protein
LASLLDLRGEGTSNDVVNAVPAAGYEAEACSSQRGTQISAHFFD